MSDQLHILPLGFIMVMGPQILTAIFLITSKKPVLNSAAMLLGVFLAASAGIALWYTVAGAIGVPSSHSDGPTTADYVIAGLLALLAVKTFLGRGEAEAPKWMTALQEAEPKKAFALAFLLIFLMPTDIAAMVSTTTYLHERGFDMIDGWPLVAITLLLMGLPLLGYLAFGHRAKEAMPGIRDWTINNAWLINLIVIVYFIYSVLS